MISAGRLVRLIILTAVALLMMASIAAAKTVTVETARARIRTGPGNYYSVAYTAYEGAELEVISEENGWYEVKLKDGKTGFVSKRSLIKSGYAKPERRYKYSASSKGVGSVSSGQIMAATRGVSDMGMFAKKYAAKYDIDPSVLEGLSVKPFTGGEYRVFVSTLPNDKYEDERLLGTGETDRMGGFTGQPLTDMDYDLGAAIAMRIVATGRLSKDTELRKYVSMVGTALAAKTPLYDEEFVFIVLEDKTPQSYSTPGGYVFITTGAIDIMDNEAELAGVLAHEIVHVVERHGMAEIEKQSTRITSESALDSLNAEIEKLGMDTGKMDVEEDLRATADKMFEDIIGGRKQEAEDASDKLGTKLLEVRGYKTTGLIDFIIKAGDAGSRSGERTSTYRDSMQRVDMIKSYMREMDISMKKGDMYQSRFSKNVH